MREKQIIEVKSKSPSRVAFPNILTLIFIVAKLFGFVDWSWWLCFTPTILYVSFVLFVLFIIMILAIVSAFK